MLTTDRAVEALVEKFAEMCSKDYSLKQIGVRKSLIMYWETRTSFLK